MNLNKPASPQGVAFGQKLNGTVANPAKLGIPGVTKGTPVTVVFTKADEAKLTVKGKTHTFALKDGKWGLKK